MHNGLILNKYVFRNSLLRKIIHQVIYVIIVVSLVALSFTFTGFPDDVEDRFKIHILDDTTITGVHTQNLKKI